MSHTSRAIGRQLSWFWAAIAFAVAVGTLGGRAQESLIQAQLGRPAVADELLVRYNRGVDVSRRRDIVTSAAAILVKRFEEVDVDHVRVPFGRTAAEMMATLLRDRDVLSVDPNYERSIVALAPPNDPMWLNNTLWGLIKINAQPVWTGFTTGSNNIVVADIDTGINYNHPDLVQNVWTNPGEIPGNGVDDDNNGYVDDVFGIDTVNGDSDPMDDHGHGTHTAGTIGARGNNGIGVVGVNWNVKILACKFLNAQGNGSDAGAIACLNYIVMMKNRGNNIRVTNNSWGAPRGNNTPESSALVAAFNAAGAAGILSAAAAGNSNNNNDTSPFDPASLSSDSIISVAASDSNDLRASFSNYGHNSVDLAAPGVNIWSTLGSGYQSLQGTSMASPHVAGAAALLLARNQGLTVADLKAKLMNSVDPVSWPTLLVSGGRLNVLNAISSVTANQQPTVSITGPATNSSFIAPASIPITVSASDPDGNVARVDYYANGHQIGSSTTAPFGVMWNNVAVGTYMLTAVATDNGGALASSTTIRLDVVTSPLFTLTPSSLSVNTGSALSISWTAPAGRPSTDWIGLYHVGDPNTAYVWWSFTSGATSGTLNLTAPSQAGDYEFRYLLNNGYSDSARSATVTVMQGGGGGNFSLTPSPTSVTAGGALSIGWTAPGGRPPTDWIGLYHAGDPNASFVWWSYTNGATSGSFNLTAPSQAGSYEFRYFLNNGFQVAIQSALVTVTPGAPLFVVTASPASVSPGGQTTVSWSAPAGRPTTDWVGLYRVGDPNTSFLWWQYTQGTTSGAIGVTLPATPGQYEFRYFTQNTYTLVATSNTVSVAGAAAFATLVIASAGLLVVGAVRRKLRRPSSRSR